MEKDSSEIPGTVVPGLFQKGGPGGPGRPPGKPNLISGQIREELERGALELVPRLLETVRGRLDAGDPTPAIALIRVLLPARLLADINLTTPSREQLQGEFIRLLGEAHHEREEHDAR